MEDLKQIQEFFSKPLNENVFVEAFKLQKALKGMGYDVKVKAVDDFGKNVFEIYFNNPADADDSIYYDVEKLGYDNVRVFANPQESVKENSHFEKRLAKMAADEKEKRAKSPSYAAASKLDVDIEDFFEKGQSYQEFKKRLDKLKENKKLTYDNFVQMVRDDMMAGSSPDDYISDERVRKDAKYLYNRYLQGASVDDLFEYNTGIYYDPAKERNAKKEVPKKSFLSILKDIKKLALKMAKENAKEASQFIKVDKVQDVNPMADIAKAEQSLVGLDEGLKDIINKITTTSGLASALSGLGFLGSYVDQLELRYYQWYYGTIQKMADYEIFELLKQRYGVEEKISTWEQKMLMYAFFVFFTIFVVAIGTKLVVKGVSRLKKEALSDYEEKEADYDKMYSDYKYKVDEAKPKKGHGEKVSKDFFAKLKGKTVNYKGADYKVIDSDEAVIKLKHEDGDTKTINLKQFNDSGLIDEIIETVLLGRQLNEKLCKKGEAYRKKRMAAGEKSSAYLSGRAVKVCKGQMKG